MGEGGEPPDVYSLLRLWEEESQTHGYDPVPVLTSLSEVIEEETEAYMKMDPDPFDERHPSRAYPNCSLGPTLKHLFRKENFMSKLVNDYLRDNYYSRLGISGRDVRKLNTAACRLMLDIIPGLDIAAVFEMPTNDALVQRLFSWAEKSIEPLQTYATGLLAAAMEVQEIAILFRDQNVKMVPLMLERLHGLQEEGLSRPFAQFGSTSSTPVSNVKRKWNEDLSKENVSSSSSIVNGYCNHESEEDVDRKKRRRTSNGSLMSPPSDQNKPIISPNSSSISQPNTASAVPPPSDCSNSSWAEMEPYVIGSVQMYPITWATKSMLILRYLTPMGEYQEFLSHVFEKNALNLIIQFINLKETRNAKVSFEALKYLASLLCHKKFSIEFISVGGLQRMLEVPRPSKAATGVSICLYYLAYCEDSMERVCLLPQHVVADLVRYGLWLLECSHDSGRCHATMFFGLSFQFRVILQEFDAQDGLRKLYNVISTLAILRVEENVVSEDEECSSRQIVRHVCVTLRKYFESHLYIKSEQVRRDRLRNSPLSASPAAHPPLPSYKAYKSSPEEVRENIKTLLEVMCVRSQWAPVDYLNRLGGVTLLLRIIALSYDWNYSGRGETVRCALDVLAMCSVMPRTQLQLCEKVELPDENNMVGFNVILGAAEGEIVGDAEVQRSALHVIVTCVCAPIGRVGGAMARYSSHSSTKKKTLTSKSYEEVIEKVWECLRTTNGIMILLNLISVKVPITDADSIRALACQALCGLSRSETVRQIIGKLPLFTTGQLQNLMKDPILQDKRQEHVMFQKYALELLERVSGRSRAAIRGSSVTATVGGGAGATSTGGSSASATSNEPSLASIHRASVIAQTRIQFNPRELLELIYNHLQSHGYTESAALLQREAGLPRQPKILDPPPPQPLHLHPVTPRGSRLSKVGLNNSCGGEACCTSPPIACGSSLTPVASVNTPTSIPSSSICVTPTSKGPPIKLNLANSIKSGSTSSASLRDKVINCCSSNASLNISSSGRESIGRCLEKKFDRSLSMGLALSPTMSHLHRRNVTLDYIITEYLTNQHALCNNPMATCPQFTLFQPHKCPDPKTKNLIPLNFATRHSRGIVSRRYNQRLLHSKFTCVHTFRYGENNAFFTCADFMMGDKFIVIGSQHGEVKIFNLQTGNETGSQGCHDSYISHVQCGKRYNLLVTSSTWRMPLSACWQLSSNNVQLLFTLQDEEYVEFSKLTEDRVIGTKSETATIYDIETGVKVVTLKPALSNQYNKNRATFSPTDELVLSDGVLWDVNSAKQIHKFDKLNQTLSGVFHPNGYELVSNTEVWDLRTFHLLKTIQTLDQSDVFFSPTSDVIYALSLEKENEEDNCFESSFKTLDASDYSSIATIDVKKNIYDLALNRNGLQIALVENQGMFENVQESIVKIYDVGRSRNIAEEPPTNEEDDEEELDGSEDGSATDDDQNNDSFVDMLEDVAALEGNSDSGSINIFSDSSSSLGDDPEDDDDEDDDEVEGLENDEEEVNEDDEDE